LTPIHTPTRVSSAVHGAYSLLGVAPILPLNCATWSMKLRTSGFQGVTSEALVVAPP